jgi:hypothetical protein
MDFVIWFLGLAVWVGIFFKGVWNYKREQLKAFEQTDLVYACTHGIWNWMRNSDYLDDMARIVEWEQKCKPEYLAHLNKVRAPRDPHDCEDKYPLGTGWDNTLTGGSWISLGANGWAPLRTDHILADRNAIGELGNNTLFMKSANADFDGDVMSLSMPSPKTYSEEAQYTPGDLLMQEGQMFIATDKVNDPVPFDARFIRISNGHQYWFAVIEIFEDLIDESNGYSDGLVGLNQVEGDPMYGALMYARDGKWTTAYNENGEPAFTSIEELVCFQSRKSLIGLHSMLFKDLSLYSKLAIVDAELKEAKYMYEVYTMMDGPKVRSGIIDETLTLISDLEIFRDHILTVRYNPLTSGVMKAWICEDMMP